MSAEPARGAGQEGVAERPPLRVTFLRTSCLLLEWGERRLLTDPFFSRTMRGLPVFASPGFELEVLPRLDLVLVSHLHPDHFDRRAMAHLVHPGLTVVGPPGIARACQGLGVSRVVELSPWQRWPQGAESEQKRALDLSLVATPALHTGPPPPEVNYVIEAGGWRVFFGGDTRLHDELSAIAARLGPLDVALLPVGGTLIFGQRTTMNASDALEACDRLRPKYVIPIHPGGEWLSLPPASLHPGRPSQLVRALARVGSATRPVVLRRGETAFFRPGRVDRFRSR